MLTVLSASITWTTKKKAVDAYMLHQRLHEEEPLLLAEMKNLILFYTQVHKTLQNDIKELEREHQMSLNEV